MVSKRGFSPLALLFLVFLLAGCTGLIPGQPQKPPVEGRYGDVHIQIEFASLTETSIEIDAASVQLIRGTKVRSASFVTTDDGLTVTVGKLDVGTWETTVHLSLAGSDDLLSFVDNVDVTDGETTSLQLFATYKNGQVQIGTEADDNDGGQSGGDDGTSPEPGDSDDGVAPEPGDGGDDGATEPGDGNGDDIGVVPGDGDNDGDDNGTEPGNGDDNDSDDGTAPGDDDKDKPQPTPPSTTRETRYIQSGNRVATRTEVYVIRSSEPGPTVMVVGGVHGGETSGWIVAGEVARTWDIDRGTLVVLPEANKDAVRRRLRTGTDGRDMNRAFPYGRPINQSSDWMMAREIWKIVEEFRPVALIDLHEGWGLREANDRFPGGTLSVGQTLITYPVGDAEQFADHVISVLNRDHNPFYGKAGYTYNFRKIGPPVKGSLAYKAGYDLRIPAFIAEPTQGRAGRHQTTVEQRAKWHRVIVDEFLRWYGVRD